MESRVVALVQSALRNRDRSGTRSVLETVCTDYGAYAAILWDFVPEKEGMEKRYLFSVADWFPYGKRWFRHDLPYSGSLTGDAIRDDTPIVTTSGDQRINNKTNLLERHSIETVACLPIANHGGCLNLYWKDRIAFDGPGREEALSVAQLLPYLHHAGQTQLRFDLIDSVKNLLLAVEVLPDSEDPLRLAKGVIQGVAEEIAKRLNCVEVSVFLEEPHQEPGAFVNMATTCPKFVYTDRYRTDDRGTLTSYVLRAKRPIHIYDLQHFHNDIARIHEQYPELRWNSKVEVIAPVMRGAMDIPKDDPDPLPPFSYMAVPVLSGDRVLGAIRCCGAKGSPHYFSANDVGALDVIAGQLAQFWVKYETGTRLQREMGVWRRYAHAIQALNRKAARALRRTVIDEKAILSICLEKLERVLPFADVLDVRLHEEDKQLYFAATGGTLWKELPAARKADLLKITYPLDKENPKSAGARAFYNQEPYIVKDTATDPYYMAIFEEVVCEVLAPIRLSNRRAETYGVLSISTTSRLPLESYVADVAKMLGQQLALYVDLARSLQELRSTQIQLDQTIQVQNQAYEDLEHQIKTPLNTAYYSAAKDHKHWTAQEHHALRGMISKARRVAIGLPTFVALAAHKKLVCKTTRLSSDKAYKVFWEACEDHKRLYPRRGLSYDIFRAGLDDLSRVSVSVDEGLFQQAVGNLIDNAFKYSFRGQAVRVEAREDRGVFMLSIKSRGLAVKKDEIPVLRERGRRGSAAEDCADGSGLGWWLVDHIMAAHGGTFDITETNAEGWTEATLAFVAEGTMR